jgi:hypothetical protein
VVYGCETWVLKENIIQKLSVFERKTLSKIFVPTKKNDETRKINTNMELGKLIQYRNIINYVKSQRLSWFGHKHRKPETSIVRKIYKWQPLATRPAGRPKYRWDDVRNELRKMKLFKWSEQAQDRLEWKKIVEKAKTLHEL